MNKRNWTIGISTALALLLALTACGSSTEDVEIPEAEVVPMSVVEDEVEETEIEEEPEIELVEKEIWESEDGSEIITIDEDAETITIDYTEEEIPFWVGTFEPETEEWVSEKIEEEEQTATCDTIEFVWSGKEEDTHEALTYNYEDENGETVTNTLNRKTETEAIVSDDNLTAEEVEEITGVAVSDVVVSDTAKDNNNTTTATTNNNEETSASPSASNSKNSDTASANDNTSASASASTGNNTSSNDSSDKTSGSTTSSGSNSGNSTGSSGSTSNSSSSNSGSSSSGSSGGSSSNSSSGSSSSGSSSSGTTTTACSHNYVGNVTKAATCSSAGVKQYTCSKCGASYTESIPATGHSYNGGVVTKAATCSTAGTTTYTCTKCGNSYTSSIPATGNHSWQAVYRTESVKVQDAVYETRVICNNCFNFSSTSKHEVQMHIEEAHNGIGGFTSGQVCIQDAVYENQQVLDHYYCTVCGATK